MSLPLEKLEFLKTNARPLLVHQSHEDLLEKEVFFVKEAITKGYPIIKQGQTNQHLYLIQSGKVALYCKHPKSNNEAFLYLKTLKTGQMFNFNSVNNTPSPFLIEALSEEVKVFKIKVDQLIDNFDSA